MLYPNLLNFKWLFLYPKRLKVAGQWRSSGTVLFSYDVEEYLDHIPSAYWNFRQAEACPSISTYLLQTCSSSISLSSQWHQQLFGDRTQNPEVPFSCSLSLFLNIKSTTRHFGGISVMSVSSLWPLRNPGATLFPVGHLLYPWHPQPQTMWMVPIRLMAALASIQKNEHWWWKNKNKNNVY